MWIYLEAQDGWRDRAMNLLATFNHKDLSRVAISVQRGDSAEVERAGQGELGEGRKSDFARHANSLGGRSASAGGWARVARRFDAVEGSRF